MSLWMFAATCWFRARSWASKSRLALKPQAAKRRCPTRRRRPSTDSRRAIRARRVTEPWSSIPFQPVKLVAGNRAVGEDVLVGNDRWRPHHGRPTVRGNDIRRGLNDEISVVRRPGNTAAPPACWIASCGLLTQTRQCRCHCHNSIRSGDEVKRARCASLIGC